VWPAHFGLNTPVTVSCDWPGQLRGVSLRQIGAMFGDRDYAAVAQEVRRMQDRAKEKRLAVSLTELKKICQRY